MSNPLGIPDDLMNSIIVAVMKNQAQAKATNLNTGAAEALKVDPAAMAKKSAATAKQLYDAYREAGFTDQQAFELVKGILTAKR